MTIVETALLLSIGLVLLAEFLAWNRAKAACVARGGVLVAGATPFQWWQCVRPAP